MHRKTRKVGFMTIKVDLEKAYDRLRWDFIRDMLSDIGISNFLSNVITKRLSSTSMQVLWSRALIETFQLLQSIHQGDPLSLYIFIMCMKCLAHEIENAMVQDRWKPIRLS